MILHSFILSLLIMVCTSSLGMAGNPQVLIKHISLDLEQTRDSKAKSTLHIYRARQYAKIKKWELALEDYNDALELNHKGWIHLERSHFLMNMGEYELAYEDANAAKEEVPTLTREADKLIEKAVAKIRKKYEAENPTTIVMDRRVDRYRKTRFDVMREQGVGMFAANTRTSRNLSSKKTASKKSTKAACAPRAKS